MMYQKIILDLASNKYINTYVAVCVRAQLRARTKKEANQLIGYVEEHHILPKCFGLGGEKDKTNFSYLTAREHFICHKLLVFGLKKTKYYWKCLKAVSAFSQSNKLQNRVLSSRSYEFARKCNSEAMKTRIISAETLLAMSLCQKGKISSKRDTHLSEGQKNKISKTKTGKPSKRKGFVMSEPQKLKISLSKQGKPLKKWSRERKEKASQRMKEAYQNGTVLFGKFKIQGE